jgi:signal transduction histidine kinase
VVQFPNNGDSDGIRTAPDFGALFEATPGPCLAMSPGDLTIVAATDSFLRSTALVRAEIIGRNLFEIVVDGSNARAADGRGVLRTAVDEVLQTLAPKTLDARRLDFRSPAGGGEATSKRRWLVSTSAVLGPDRVVTSLVLAFEDVTQAGILKDELTANLETIERARLLLQGELASDRAEIDVLARELALRKRAVESAMSSAVVARDEALRTGGLKTRFLAMISHELRTPLTALCLQVERMQRHAGDLDHRHRESLDRIAFSSTRLREMIDTLLEYARVDAGRVAVNPMSFDLREAVKRTLENHRHEAEQRGLVVRHEPPATPALVRSDQRLVELVISNLIDNAIKFTNDGGVEVTLGCSPNGAHHVAVRDSGPGIPDEQQKKIFEPFEQLTSDNRRRSGIGLGLALVVDIAAALEGRIELRSKPGEGSTFTFVVPSLVSQTSTQSAGG